jgi:propionate CoA-transferase
VRYDPRENILYLNFEGLTLDADADVEALEVIIERRLAPIERRVHAIVNYDNFSLAPAAADAFWAVVARNQALHFLSSSRHSSSAFFRRQLAGHLAPVHLEQTVYRDSGAAKDGLRRTPTTTRSQ